MRSSKRGYCLKTKHSVTFCFFFFSFLFFCSGDHDLFDRIRGQDIRLLKTLKVKYICDLMVEKKKVKFGMRLAECCKFSV